MAKSNGLGDALFFNGYDLSGDVGSVQSMRMSLNPLDVTGLNKFAHERIAGIRDGSLDFKAFYNPATSHEHPVLDQIPTTDLIVVYCRGTALGDSSCGIIGKELGYSENRSPSGLLEDTINVKANGHGLQWGVQLTAGQRTDAAATNGTGVQRVNALPTAINIASVAVSNPGQVNTSTPHNLVTGDSVVIAGTTTTPSINSRYTITKTSATQFTIPVNVTSGQAGAAGTVQQTSTDFGWAAYLNVFSFSGTDVTVKLQDSADNSTYADLTGGAFTAITGATPQAQRIAAASSTAIVREYVRVVTTTSGGFASLGFAVTFVRYHAAIID